MDLDLSPFPIKDPYMQLSELLQAQDYIITWRRLPPKNRLNEGNLIKYINACITVRAHSWCMDDYLDRAAMTNLIINLVKEFDEIRNMPHATSQ